MKTQISVTHLSSHSRRQWVRSSLAACGYLAAGGLGLAQADQSPALPGFTQPGTVTARKHSLGMQSRLVDEGPDGEKCYALIFGKGDEILSGLTEFAEREKLTSGRFTAIGALQSARFGWYDAACHACRGIPINQQVELVSLIGELGLVNGALQIHAHGTVGQPNGQMRGGHLLEAIAWPPLEVCFTAFPENLSKSATMRRTFSALT